MRWLEDKLFKLYCITIAMFVILYGVLWLFIVNFESSGIGPSFIVIVTEAIFKVLLGISENLERAELHRISESSISWLGFLLSLLLLIGSFWLSVRTLRRNPYRQIFRSRLIGKNESDALEYMAKYYQKANRIIAFSGDYSFIFENTLLRETVHQLAKSGNIVLFSYKSEEQVNNAFSGHQELFADLLPFFRFNSEIKQKSSFIERNGPKIFLYRSDKIHEGDGHSVEKRICSIYSNNEGVMLMGIIEQLVDTIVKTKQT